jgi:hypothetical protein
LPQQGTIVTSVTAVIHAFLFSENKNLFSRNKKSDDRNKSGRDGARVGRSERG